MATTSASRRRRSRSASPERRAGSNKRAASSPSTLQWTRGQLEYAKDNETGVRKGQLRSVELRAPAAVLFLLWRYGYLGDHEMELSMEMADMFHRYKTRRVPVDSDVLRLVKAKLKQWRNT